ncbi:hypothetical protein BDZ94DRAFT_1180392 [Collybia nuda]|uniref:Uncharacterized protein n=1 Tax=Collybia nuda TaxID=64659 RepID=A0A9P5XT16_9AGAR|nr:hypothetical protein BDZ94DRAFT_1180392 [Collybia nuda]
MGFWYPDLQLGFYCPIDFDIPCKLASSENSTPVFFFEALCVASAIHSIDKHCLSTRTAVIYSDNSNTVDMFNSLRALPPYNPILTSSVDSLLSQSIDIRVLHIDGSKNSVADALSRGKFELAKSLAGNLSIINFTPPRNALGAVKK